MLKKLVTLSFIVLFINLNTYRAKAQQATTYKDVIMLQEKDELPSNMKMVGSIKVVDGGVKINCGYNRTVQQAKEKAFKKGGNVLKITKMKQPNFMSSCYQIWGDVYQVGDIGSVTAAKDAADAKVIHSLLPDTAKYALLYIYRPKTFTGMAVSYNIHADEEKLFRVKNDSRSIVKLYKEGKTNIWGRTEARAEEIIDVKHGEVYFLRCTVGMGAFVGQPKLAVVSATRGLREFEEVSDVKVTDDDVYNK